MIRIAVADDHPIVRDGIRRLVSGVSDIQVCAEAGTAADLLRNLTATKVDAILLDLMLPDANGLDLLHVIGSQRPGLPVIIFTNAVDAAATCLERGARGFVTKDASREDVATAIRLAVNGDVFVSPTARRYLGSGPGDGDGVGPPHLTLSRRELDVMLKLVRGLRPKEIALDLGISAKTVDTYRSRVMKKLGVSDHRELLLYALRNGLTDWD